jgi:acyl carrier protein
MSLLEIINTVLRNRGLLEIQELKSDLHLRNDIGFESLDLAELTARIEAEFDVDIFEDGIVYTIGEIIEKIEK